MRWRFLAAALVVVFSFCLFDAALPWLKHGPPVPRLTATGWIDALQDASNPTRRTRAVDALWQFEAAIVPDIMRCLHHPASQVRASACLALKSMGPLAEPAVPDLVELVQDPAEPARLEAIQTLASIGAAAQPAAPAMLAATADPDERIRVAATLALGQFGQAATPALLGLLHDGDLLTRRLAVEALAQGGPRSQHVCDQLALAATGDEELRIPAIEALSVQGGQAVAALSRLLHNEDPLTRSQAAVALCRMGAPAQGALPELLDALDDDQPNVRFWALRTLAGLELRPADQGRVIAALDDRDDDVRWQARDTMSRQGLVEYTYVNRQRGIVARPAAPARDG